MSAVRRAAGLVEDRLPWPTVPTFRVRDDVG
jgi:hypothetical protein